jgi:biopolymer transport protein ExbB/TolQ
MHDHTLQPLDLFLQAGPVVKAVFVCLIVMSVWCWMIIADCTLALSRLRRDLRQALRGHLVNSFAPVVDAGIAQSRKHLTEETIDSIRERITGSMKRRVQELIETSQGGLATLAVISSVAPFVGLFGTVWGIMTSFIGIASAKDTSLAVVAPGIAEALAATAVGLAAAIPAAFAYNRLAAGFTRTGRAYQRFVDDEGLDLVAAAQLRSSTVEKAQ